MIKTITRFALLLTLALTGNRAFAQTMIPLPAHSTLYTTQARGFWFEAPCNFTITGVRVPLDAGSGDQYIQIMDIGDNPPVVYGTMSTNFTNLAYITAAPNGVIQNVSIPVTTGQRIGILGTVGSSSGNSYSSSSPYASSINGFSVNLGRFITQQSNGIYNQATPDYSTESTGSLGRVEIYYSVCDKPTSLNISGVTSNSANHSWTAVSGSIGYEYKIDQTATPPTTAGTATTATTANSFGLTSNTNYFLHVRNRCDATTYSLWETKPFTTLVNPCGYQSVASYNTPTATTADFHWYPMPGSMGYEYIVDQIGASPIVPGTATTDTFANVTSLTGGQTYYLHLRNKCTSTGGTWSDWNTMQFIMPECKAPNNILFSGVTDTAVDVLWALMPAANMYEYQVDVNRADPTGASGYSSTLSMTAHINGLIPNTKYYAHIRSRCFINDISTWALDSFVTNYACNPPVPNVVNPGAATVTVNWPAVTDAVQYEYRISSNPNYPAFGDITTTATTLTTTLPADDKNYYLHIRTKCNSQFEFSPWARRDLRVSPTGVNTLQEDIFAVNVYPNPAQDKITILVDGNKDAEGNVEITDIAGRVLIKTIMTGNATLADISQLPAGMYLLKYQDTNNSKTIKLEKK
ncbi:MAG: T9SS type A sorting domain-containing protein [Sphingobacteriales bacterium]|nr:MAG: T9SS type A sorting domain-containing protein [Sphingobacteriales bacterium]